MIKLAWLPGYAYRKAYEVHPVGGCGTNHQVKVKVYYNTSVDYLLEGFDKYLDNPLTLPWGAGDSVIHPDVLYFPEGKDGYKYWMVYTPMPEAQEKPFIVRSNDGISWTAAGIGNPVLSTVTIMPDPDFIYVPEYDKFFMAICHYAGGGGVSQIFFAYSNDGINWTELGAALIDGTPAYEKDNLGTVRVMYPTMIYEDGWFYIWYGCPNGAALINNGSYVSLAKFQWDDVGNTFINLARDGGNPIFYPAADGEYMAGCGHMDVGIDGSTYYMYTVRRILGGAGDGNNDLDVALFTSTNKTTWTNKGRILSRDGVGTFTGNALYRSGILHHGEGEIAWLDTEESITRLYISGFQTAAIGTDMRIGFAITKSYVTNLSTKCKTDFGDVRFTTSDGNTKLSYWLLEKVDGDYAVFWVKVTDDLSSLDKTIYVYYGNVGVSTTSNPANTMENYDDGTTENMDEATQGDSSITHVFGKLRISEDSIDDAFIVGKTQAGWGLCMTIKEIPQYTSDSAGTAQLSFGFFDSASLAGILGNSAVVAILRRILIYRYCSNVHADANKIIFMYWTPGGVETWWDGNSWQAGNLKIASSGTLEYRIYVTNTKAFLQVFDGSGILAVAPLTLASVKAFSNGKAGGLAEQYNNVYFIGQTDFDNFFIRKFTTGVDALELIGSFSGEEIGVPADPTNLEACCICPP